LPPTFNPSTLEVSFSMVSKLRLTLLLTGML